MISLLLPIIYISFISLGLPDSMLGAAWPSMYESFGARISDAGIVSMLIAFCTVISSLMCDKLIRRFGTGGLTALSVGMTAAALVGFSFSSSILELCLWGIPYGLGAGSVDAALNNYVAIHYKAKHMSWLHCFWGLGASLGPYIMGMCLTNNLGWRSGYRIVFIIQVCLTAVLIFSVPLWKKNISDPSADKQENKSVKISEALRLPGASFPLLAFFCYCSLEQLVGLWGASFMIFGKDISEDTAAILIAVYYGGITIGRIFSGFLTAKLSDKQLIFYGEIIILAGIALLAFAPNTIILCIGFALVGLGCAPIYPSIMHQTPFRFGENASQVMISLQMASAYVGTTVSPALTGFLMEKIHVYIFPVLSLVFALIMMLMTALANASDRKKGTI